MKGNIIYNLTKKSTICFFASFLKRGQLLPNFFRYQNEERYLTVTVLSDMTVLEINLFCR